MYIINKKFKYLNVVTMNFFIYFRKIIEKKISNLIEEGLLKEKVDTSHIVVEYPRDPNHGDISTNVVLVLSKYIKKGGKDIKNLANVFITALKKNKNVVDCTLAGPGFINIKLSDVFWQNQLSQILKEGINYGASNQGNGEKINVEYGSVNPTGPIHVGHSRGIIVGDVLASLLNKVGYNVTREFYINDAGEQANELACSVYKRYLQALGHKVEKIGSYPGDYLMNVGKKLVELDGNKWEFEPKENWLPYVRGFAIKSMMDLIELDLQDLGVQYDIFISEKKLIDDKKIEEAFNILEDKKLIYNGVLPPPKGKKIENWKERKQTLFKSTKFGDDIDRPLKKSDNSWTYFAGDIANHLNKYQRGFNTLINVWGADHGGYVKRLISAVKAVTDGATKVDVRICQMVNFLESGIPIKMSKRSGTFIYVRDVINKVGLDSMRFFMLTRNNDAHLEFDFDKVVEQSRENPVFYVQYAHARACSVKRHVKKLFKNIDISSDSLSKIDLSDLKREEEILLIKMLAKWPSQVIIAAEAKEPHRLATYLYDLAAQFHMLWNKGKEDATLRFIYPNDEKITMIKFALVKSVANVIASGLNIFGVEPVEEML